MYYSRNNADFDYPIEDMIKNYNMLHLLIGSGAEIYFGNLIYLEINYKRGILSKSGNTFGSNVPTLYDYFLGGTFGLNISKLVNKD